MGPLFPIKKKEKKKEREFLSLSSPSSKLNPTFSLESQLSLSTNFLSLKFYLSRPFLSLFLDGFLSPKVFFLRLA